MPSKPQVTLKGVLKRSQIGMGGWILITEDDKKIDLYGPIPKHLIDKHVYVKGHLAQMGIGMGDGALRVDQIGEE